MMFRARTIDDLLQDPEFLSSREYANFKSLVDQGAYPTVRDCILSLVESAEQVRREDCAAWPDEIRAAVEADSRGRTFPPMHRVAASIGYVLDRGDPSLIPESHWEMLQDFLCGAHRGKKGKPRTESKRQYDADILLKYEQLMEAGLSPSKAQSRLAEDTEIFDIRTIQNIIVRARRDRENAEIIEHLSSLDMCRFFEDTDETKSRD